MADTEEEPHEVVRLSGDVDMYAAPDTWRVIEDRLGGGSSRFEIDLAEVGYIDSSGLAVLVRTQQALAARNRTLVLTNVGPHVRHVITLAGLTADLGV